MRGEKDRHKQTHKWVWGQHHYPTYTSHIYENQHRHTTHNTCAEQTDWKKRKLPHVIFIIWLYLIFNFIYTLVAFELWMKYLKINFFLSLLGLTFQIKSTKSNKRGKTLYKTKTLNLRHQSNLSRFMNADKQYKGRSITLHAEESDHPLTKNGIVQLEPAESERGAFPFLPVICV